MKFRIKSTIGDRRVNPKTLYPQKTLLGLLLGEKCPKWARIIIALIVIAVGFYLINKL